MQKIIIAFLLLCQFSYGQSIGGEQIDVDNILTWNVDISEEYEGTYFFGFSEMESQITVSIAEGLVCVQLRRYEWMDDESGEHPDWVPIYENYTNVSIKGNKFYSDQSNGEFVLYNDEKGLKLDNPPFQMGDDGEYEIGLSGNEEKSNFYYGKYTETIFEIIEEDVLKAMSLDELQIVRNEIFARYGYIFKARGKMANYFNKQDWYRGLYKDVDDYITEIERMNIVNIQEVERSKREDY